MKLTPKTKKNGNRRFNNRAAAKFLEVFSETLNKKLAAEMCGWHVNTINSYERKHENFRKKMDEARDQAVAIAEAEAFRRAVQGTDEPVFFKGEQCGVVRRYSDTLLQAILKAYKPDVYNQNKTSVELSGKDGGPIEISHARSKLLDIINQGVVIDATPGNRLEDHSEE